jgi:hypothetical protein
MLYFYSKTQILFSILKLGKNALNLQMTKVYTLNKIELLTIYLNLMIELKNWETMYLNLKLSKNTFHFHYFEVEEVFEKSNWSVLLGCSKVSKSLNYSK